MAKSSNGLTKWLLVILAIVSALVAVAGGYYTNKTNIDNDKADLQEFKADIRPRLSAVEKCTVEVVQDVKWIRRELESRRTP